MYTIIERYSPEHCLVEDTDGIRILWVQTHVSEAAWRQAHESGAQAIVREAPRSYLLAASWVEQYHQDGLYLIASESSWIPLSAEQPDLRDLWADDVDQAPPSNFVHLHTHSEYSALDGITRPTEMVELAKQLGHSAIAITDHGVCAGQPALQLACDAAGIKAIHGMEAYFVDDRHDRDPEKRYAYWHICLWAATPQGLLNLWALSTESYRSGLYGKPRIDWELLERYQEGLIASTGCLKGPLADPFVNGDAERSTSNVARLKGIFGDRLYVELHTNLLPEQVLVNHWAVQIADEQEVECIAVCDSHYPEITDADAHGVWMAVQTNKDVGEDTDLFRGDCHYHLMTDAEVREALGDLDPDVIERAMDNTGKLAARCDAKIEKRSHTPVYTRVGEHSDPRQADIDKLREVCMRRWDERVGVTEVDEQKYSDRFDHEFNMICRKGFAGYYLMVWDLVNYFKNNGILVGPGRGSGGGSLVAYLLGIVETDPVELNVLFERFMTEGRTELPDFDLDFPSSKKQEIFDYAAERWGVDHVAIVGTHGRAKNKQIFKDLARALAPTLPDNYFPDIEDISAMVDDAQADTAGLGLTWDLLMDRIGEQLEPYRKKYPELFRYADRLNHRLRQYGQHPAGIVIDPEHSLTDSLPLRNGDRGMVCQFDLAVLEQLGYVKFDFLNLRNLDTLQQTIDLIQEHTGQRIEPYAWRDELEDPEVWEQISLGRTLGMFQISTNLGVDLCLRYKPRNLVELAHVITLVRPGPRDSGLQELYLRRRDTGEQPTYPDPRMADVLAETQGCLLFQEQLMKLCILIAGYTDVEADKVRKILGKKKVEEAKKEASVFIERAVKNGTDRRVAADLWAQMEAFARYSFGYAHAISYALLAIWCAWFKLNYPIYYMAASLSTVKDADIPLFVEETRAMGYRVLPPDVNVSGVGFTVDPPDMAVRYGLMAIKGIGEAATRAIVNARPYESWDDFAQRKGSECNSGHVKVLNQIGAFESIAGHRRALQRRLEIEALPSSQGCVHRSEYVDETTGLPCSFDWSSLPPAYGKSGKLLKKQPGPPKTCSRACKKFSPMVPPGPDEIEPYTDDDIQKIERDTLGVYLSSTPFDRFDPEDLSACSTAEDVRVGELGQYLVPAVLQAVRPKYDKNGNPFAWLTVLTPRGTMTLIAFHTQYETYSTVLVSGRLCLLLVKKTDRGQQLVRLEDLDAERETV